MIKIDKGKPLPKKSLGVKRKVGQKKYPFDTMEIGDSFGIPFNNETENKDKETIKFNLAQAVQGFCRNNKDYKFTIRTQEKEIRVWRIEKK